MTRTTGPVATTANTAGSARSRRHRRRSIQALAIATSGLLVLSACSDDSDSDADTTDSTDTASSDTASSDTAGSADAFATAAVANADGDELGTATLADVDGDSSELSVEFSGLEPGMYGMHLHAVGTCEPDSVAPDDDSDNPETGDFLSAGGHLGADGHDHPDHGGDLPALLVNENGEGKLTVSTDRITEEDLLDDDGSAIIIHEDADNYGNVPERYAEDGPDEDTLSTGDAGGRQACGAFEAA
ncbi:MAG TPA: superoxide dismutase family protein [Candidatus Corynebacterium avicola]|uniref:Superoxide dismutase family protein n=1 Tax=Candidatus Corynebacterium avicola TaxID=2838527 RepID=A0A9D1RPE2_9CORY|nr:superoxide dismutase family protein [Candidatus Corynebacterium avicola]